MKIADRMSSRIIRFVSLATILLASPLYAGTGKIRRDGGVNFVDFDVSVRFNAAPAELDNIRRALADGSEILADATDGQFRFGNIAIRNNSTFGREAEAWVMRGTGRANASSNGFGIPDAHVNFFYDDNFVGNPAIEGDAYSVAHEFTHLIWGVRDEYVQCDLVTPAECEPLPGSTASTYSLMDNFFTRGGNIGTGGIGPYTLNELCVPSNHDPDRNTCQQASRMQSCWETIASHPSRAGIAPVALPLDAPPPTLPPHILSPASAGRHFVLLLDRSLSMFLSGRFDLAKTAGNIFISLMRRDDQLGIVSFAFDARVELGLLRMGGIGPRVLALVLLDTITAEPFTALGGGLIGARELLLSSPDLSGPQTIVLITDGWDNLPPDELSVIPSLVQNDISVIAVAIGENAQVDNLQTIATQTGGLFFHVRNEVDVPGLMSLLSAETNGGAAIANQPGIVSTGSTNEAPVFVDAQTRTASFVLNWQDRGDDLDLKVESPSGIRIGPVDSETNPEVSFFDGPGVEMLIVTGSALEKGAWRILVTGADASHSGRFSVQTLSDAEGMSLPMFTDRPSYNSTQSMTIQAIPAFGGQSVVGATVEAVVTSPSGFKTPLTLFDDGSETHGDGVANDGSYSGRYSFDCVAGAYAIDAVATVESGETYGGEPLFESAGAPSSSIDVPRFTRVGHATAIVDTIDVTANAGEDVTVECSPTTGFGTPVQLDGNKSGGGSVIFQWSAPNVAFDDSSSPTPVGQFPLGTTTVTLTVSCGEFTSTDTTQVTVVDTIPPELHVSITPDLLWPPNHRMTDVAASVVASDVCSTTSVSLRAITSTEADDAQGSGDGSTLNDIQGAETGSLDLAFQLRAERNGRGEGRVYTVSYAAIDESGNSTDTAVLVLVPHDQSVGTEPVLLTAANSDAGTYLQWRPVSGAVSYRVVRGYIGNLREAGDFIDLGVVSCIQSESTAVSTVGHEDVETPSPGEAFFYLVAYDNGHDSGYGTDAATKPRVKTGMGCE